MKTIIGVFPDQIKANAAIEHLWNLGFKSSDISVVVKDQDSLSQESGTKGGEAVREVVARATTGGFVGGLAGILIGLSALIIPGVGAFLIGGPIALALGLTGAAATAVSGAATGILAGGMVGALASLGIPESTAHIYQEGIQKGGVLLAVPARSDTDREEVERVFEIHDANELRVVDGLRTVN